MGAERRRVVTGRMFNGGNDETADEGGPPMGHPRAWE